jgi:hypothetical protein
MDGQGEVGVAYCVIAGGFLQAPSSTTRTHALVGL